MSDEAAAAAEAADGAEGAAGNQEPTISKPSIEKFESWEALEAGYKEMESYRGNSVRIPSEDAGKDVWDQFDESIKKVPGVVRLPGAEDKEGWGNLYGQLGRPEEPAGYAFDNPEGVKLGGEEQAGFAKAAHENNLTREQAQGLYKYLASGLGEAQSEIVKAQQQDTERLKGEWGQAYDHNVSLVKAAAKQLDGKLPGVKDYIDAVDFSGNAYDTNTVKMLHLMAGLMGETGAIDMGRPDGAISPAEAMLQASEIRDNPDHPYNNELDPAHGAAQEKMKELYKAAYSK